MGQRGMGEMSEHQMPAPRNSIPMRGGVGPYGVIDMGGMFTIIKVRDEIREGVDPGWYKPPRGTVAWRVGAEQRPATQPQETASQYTCPMHPEVVSAIPGTCPKCGMALVPKK